MYHEPKWLILWKIQPIKLKVNPPKKGVSWCVCCDCRGFVAREAALSVTARHQNLRPESDWPTGPTPFAAYSWNLLPDYTEHGGKKHIIYIYTIYIIYISFFVVPSHDSTENNIASVGGIVKYFWQTHKRTLKKNPRGFQVSFCAAIGFKPSFSNFFSKASSHRLENGLRCYYCPPCCLKPALFGAHHSLIDLCKPNSWTKCNIHLDSHWRHWESIFSIFHQLICYWHFRISTHRVTARHSDDTLSTCNLIASPEAGPRPAVGELRLPTDQVNHFNHT